MFLSSRSRTVYHRTGQAGFTLIEIMVVIAIIAGILVTIAPKLIDRQADMKKAVRHLAAVTRETHNAARLYNSTYRLVIHMDENKRHSYSIESTSGNITLLSEEQEKERERNSAGNEAQTNSSGFSEDARILRKPEQLPKGLYFGEIEYGNRGTAISDGIAYVHFFPQGLTEEAVFHITDKKNLDWTITLHPITGHATIYDKKISLKELKEQ